MEGTNLKSLSLEGALDLVDTFPIKPEKGIKEDSVTIFIPLPRHNCEDYYQFRDYNVLRDKVVYLFTDEQVTNFKRGMIRSAKAFKIEVKRQPEKDVKTHSYIAMNPGQAEIYLSVGIDRLVAVNPADLERIFRRSR